jgi:hypothetical protein
MYFERSENQTKRCKKDNSMEERMKSIKFNPQRYSLVLILLISVVIGGCGGDCDNDGICDWTEKAESCGDCAVCGNGVLEFGEECDPEADDSPCDAGFVCNDICRCEPAIPIAETDELTTLREGPGPNYPSIIELSPGSTAEVIGVSQDGNYWKVSVSDTGQEGWVRIASVNVAGDTSDIPVAAAPPPPEKPTEQTGPEERPECCYSKGPTAMLEKVCTCPCPPEQPNPVSCTK